MDVDIKAAEIVTVLGPTGCGKSSTLNLIAGFEQTSTGSLLIDGKPIDGPGPRPGGGSSSLRCSRG